MSSPKTTSQKKNNYIMPVGAMEEYEVQISTTDKELIQAGHENITTRETNHSELISVSGTSDTLNKRIYRQYFSNPIPDDRKNEENYNNPSDYNYDHRYTFAKYDNRDGLFNLREWRDVVIDMCEDNNAEIYLQRAIKTYTSTELACVAESPFKNKVKKTKPSKEKSKTINNTIMKDNEDNWQKIVEKE